MSEPHIEVSGDETRAHPRKTGRPNFDFIIAISAIAMSAISLFVAIENGISQRDLVAADTWPFLRAILSNGYDEQNNVAIGLSNGGVGPAKIKTFELFYKGTPVSSGVDLLRKCCGLRAGTKGDLFSYSVVDGTVLRPAEYNPVLRVYRSSPAPEIPDRVADALNDIAFKVCYCSILDACWITDLKSINVTSVRECRAPAHKFEPNGN